MAGVFIIDGSGQDLIDHDRGGCTFDDGDFPADAVELRGHLYTAIFQFFFSPCGHNIVARRNCLKCEVSWS